MDPATAKSCVGPCLYWCPNNKHTLLVFVVGFAFGIMITRIVEYNMSKRRRVTNPTDNR